MNETDVIFRAKRRCVEMMATHPGFIPLQEALEQLSYIEAALMEDGADRSRLKDITLGLLAAREFEVRDFEFAESLYLIEEIVDRMKKGEL